MKQSLRVMVLVVAVGATGGLLASGGDESRGRLPAVTHAQWQAECSACHLAYHPGLLPERSWHRIMAGLDQHFGENASLDAATAADIDRFLAANAADRSDHRRSRRIAGSITPGAAPLRISDTPWFVREHREIAAATWRRPKIGSPANCAACHQGADQGDFSERRIRIPK